MSFDALSAALRALPADARAWPRLRRRAAIAIVLRDGPRGPDVLLMRRVERPGDRWSGDVSCPGGFQHAGEELLTTAIRETREEIALDLSEARLLGALTPRPEAPWHRMSDFALTPFVFEAPAFDPALAPDPREVVSVRWFPLAALADPGRRVRFWWWWRFARPFAMPVRVERVVVEDYDLWGLTLRILDDLVRLPGPAR